MAHRRIRAAVIIAAMSIVSGAVAGMLVALIYELATGGFSHPIFRREVALVSEIGAEYGGILGTVLGPVAAFGFLRRAPIGRLFGQTIIGAVCGGLLGVGIGVGLHITDIGDNFVMIFGGGVIGFCAAAARLWWCSREGVAQSLATPAVEER